MPGFLRSHRRRLSKLSEKQHYQNSLLVETCARVKEGVTVELKQCLHKVTSELEIPNKTCEDCAWEDMDTDEYDPDAE